MSVRSARPRGRRRAPASAPAQQGHPAPVAGAIETWVVRNPAYRAWSRGMAAGADSIDDMDLLRHGAMPDLFGGIRAPSTLGSHLRSYTWGNVRQLEAVSRQLLAELARRAPLLPGRDTLAFVDIDAMQKRV